MDCESGQVLPTSPPSLVSAGAPRPRKPRTPGLGSAIFLHINIGTPTAGCVTLPAGELLEILRWLNPAASPQIAMGVGAPGTAGG